MTGAPVMLDLKGLNKFCFGWVKFGHAPHLMPFLALSDPENGLDLRPSHPNNFKMSYIYL